MLSLIVALGAQNVFVLRQGIRRQHTTLVIFICIFSDVLLVAVGVAGLGRLVNDIPWLMTAARWGGALFLLTYAAFAARRALNPSGQGMIADGEPVAGNKASAERRVIPRQSVSGSAVVVVALQTLAFTWLNPGVYLDTVVLIGSLAATHGQARWIFAAGAMTASAVWFLALGYGARYLGKWLRTPRAWQYVDAGIAVVLIAMAVVLLAG